MSDSDKECILKTHLYLCALLSKAFTADELYKALQEVDAVKADRPEVATLTLPASGWVKDSAETSKYVYYCDVAVEGVTVDDVPNVTVNRDSRDMAVSCGLCTVNETLAGKIRFRAVSAPLGDIKATYWIMTTTSAGKETS